jgi:hypothetical protein
VFVFIQVLFAAGGDTITYTSDVENLADGDVFYSDIHYHSMKDTVAAVVNGRLGNINIASDAEIDLSKLDTTGNFKGDTITVKKIKTDTIRSNPDVDSIKGNPYIDSIVTGYIAAGNVLMTGDMTGLDSVDARVITVDTAYSSGGVRGLRLYMQKATIDSFVNNVVAYNATANGTYIGLFKDQTALPGTSNYYPTIKTNNGFMYISVAGRWLGHFESSTENVFELRNNANTSTNVSINADGLTFLNGGNVSIGNGSLTVSSACTTATINTGYGNFEIGQSILTSSAVTFSTVNTGQGANELYDMNQNVQTTDDVTFDSVRVTDDVVVTNNVDIGGGLQFDSGDLLTVYDTGSFVCSLYTDNNTTLLGTGTAKYQQVGNQVTIFIPYIDGTAVSDVTGVVVRNVPATLRSSLNTQNVPASIYESGAWTIGLFSVRSGSPYFLLVTSVVGAPASGTFRTGRPVATYFLN